MDTRTTDLRERLRRSRDWMGEIESLAREAETLGSDSERSDLFFALGTVTEEVVPKRELALKFYQLAWKLRPENLEALARARQVYRELGRLEMVAKLGEIELKGSHESRAGELAAMVGEALLDSGERERAIPLLEQALEANPDSSGIRDALAAVNYDPEFWLDTVEKLTTDAEKTDSTTAARMLLRAARIVNFETPGDSMYEQLLRKVLEFDAQHENANFLFESLLAKQARWDELEAHHERRAYAAAEDQDRAELYRTFALEWMQRFEDSDRAVRFFTKAIEASASNGKSNLRSIIAAFMVLHEGYGGKNEWTRLLDLADLVLDRVSEHERLFIATQAGTVAWKQLADLDRARGYFDVARAIEPSAPLVCDFDAEVPAAVAAEAEASSSEAAASSEESAPVAGDGGKGNGKRKRGKKDTKAPAAEAAAISAPETAAEPEAAPAAEPEPAAEAPAEQAAPAPVARSKAPAREESFSADQVAAMDAARKAESAADGGVAAWREAIAVDPSKRGPRRELARVLRAQSQWNQLLDALREEEQKACDNDDEKAETWRDIAKTYNELNNDNQVIHALGQVQSLVPDDLTVYDDLAALYEGKKRWPDLVKILGEKAERVSDNSERVALFLQVANLYLDRFSNQAEAIKAFERVLEIDEENAEAVSHLLQVYEKRRDWEKLIRLREGELARADESQRAALTIEVAQLAATKVKKPEICIYWWEKVLEVDPAHEEAISELYKLYERSKEWDKLAEICSKQANIASDEKTQIDALQKLGLLYTDKLEDGAKAIDAWRRLLLVDPENRRGQDALKKLYVSDKRWDDLEAFYRERDKIDEYVRVLEREVDTGEGEEVLALASKVAVLYRDEIGKADRAMRAFEKVLSIDESNLEAAEALIPLYEQGRDPRKLVSALEIQLAATTEPSLRQERIKRIAEYSEEKLRDKGAAMGWWLKAHEEDHEAEWIRVELERLAQETGAWIELVAAYEASFAKFTEQRDALPLMLVVARVLEEELSELDRALALNAKIIEIDDSNEQAINALERLYLGKQQYQELLDIYTRKLDLTVDGEVRTRIQFKIGQLYEDEVKDDAKAIEAYQAIIEANGDDATALRALDRIYVRNESWSELADILSRLITIIGPDEDPAAHIECKYRLGQLRSTHLGDVPGAIDAYRDILDLDGAHEGARVALEERLTDDDNKLAAAAILEPVYENLGEWQKLIGVHEIQAAADSDSLRRVGLLMRIGELYAQRLGNAEQAFDAYARCFREDPASEGAKNELEQLGMLLDDGWPRLVALFEEALGREELDPALAHELATKVARAYEDRLDNSAKAVEYFRRALAIEPDDMAALDALEAIFTRGEAYADLLEVLRKKADLVSDADDRLGTLFRIAAINEEMLQNADDAISTYREILGQDGDNVRALRALDRLYVSGAHWQDLGDNLSRQLSLVENDHERVELLVRLAELRDTHLEEPAAAIETYRQVLELRSDNEPSVTALERLITNAEYELTIAQILEPIYKATGQWQKQIRIYEIMAKHAFDPERKIELLHQIAELNEIGSDNAGAAFDTYARALSEDPRNEGTIAQLERLARGSDRLRDLVALYDQLASDSADEDLKVALLTRAARVYEFELGEDANAVATHTRVLEAAPGYVEAASAIQAIHERNADYPPLVAILKRKSEIILDLPERKDLLYKAAQIEEEVLEDNDAAIATYLSILDIDDIDERAMDALERIYIRLERWEPLISVYAKKADLAEDPDDKKRRLYVLGQVFDRELGDVTRAIETYQAVLDIDPDELAAIQALDRLYGSADRGYDLLQILERQVELAESTGEMVGLKYRIGDLWQHKLGDLVRAVESYREALEIDPGHLETLSALDGLMRSKEGEPLLAARVLEPIYEGTGEFGHLVDVVEVMVAASEDPLQRVEHLHRVASLLEFRLDRSQEAFDAYARALRDDNGNEQTLEHLERLAEQINTFPALASLYASEAEKSLDVPRQVDLLSRLARVYEQELGDTEAAIATYKKILEVDFDNRSAVLSLDRLYSKVERWDSLVEILRKEVQLAETDEEVTTLQFRLGQTLEQALGDLPGAIEVYRDILATNPTHASTLAALEMMFLDGHHQIEIARVLEPLYETAGEFEKLHKIYEVQLTKLTELADRQSMYQRLAELAEAQLYDQPRAFHWWGEALAEDPRWEQAGDEVERLAGELGAWEQLTEVYARILELHTDRDLQRSILLRAGRVFEFELGDANRAVDTQLRVIEIDQNDPDALAALDRLYTGAGMYDELVEVLRRRIGVTLDGEELLELQFRRGAIFSEALGDLDAAHDCYVAVLEQESRNRRALECLEEIHFRREEWQKLFDIYEKLIDVADGDDELAEVYARMARICSDALGNDEQSMDFWGRVLDIRGEDAAALAALAELYGRAEKWEELVETIERQVSVAATEHDQIVLYKRLGRVWEEKLGRERNALDAWLCADRIDANDLETLNSLAHLYQSTQSWEELSSTLRRIIQVGQMSGDFTEEQMVELFAQLGQLEGDILGRVDDAVEAWRHVVALHPADFRALNALEQLFTREARWEESIDILERRALVVDDPSVRIDTLLQAAATWEEKVGDLNRAAEVYERVRAADPANVVASERLEAIYRAQYKWEQLNEVLLERVEARDDVHDQIEILNAVARIFEQELGDQESAFVVLQAAFKRDYAHEETARELERLAEATDRWKELLDEYTTAVKDLEVEDTQAACDLWVKIGGWYGEHLSHIEWAIHSIQQALRLDPNHTGALSAVADLQRKRGSWAELVETLSHHARVETNSARKVELYLALADLLEGQIQDPIQAISAYQSALSADQTSLDALISLERLYRRSEMWEQLIDVLGRMAELRTADDEVVRLRLEIGELWDLRMLDSGQAIVAYRSVLDVDPNNLPALRALEALYEKTGESERYLEVLEAQLDVSPSDAESISLYERMSAAWEERFGKLDRAAECLEKIVAIDPRNYEAYRELARLYRQDEKWESLVDTYRNHIMNATDAIVRIDLYCAMGDVYERELEDVDRAIESYTDVLSFDADEPRALDALGRLYERISEWDRAIDVMTQAVALTDEPNKQVDLYQRIGRIFVTLGDAEQAVENLLRALTINQAHVPTMEALVRLYSDRGDWLKAAQMMVRAETHTANALDKVRLLFQAAKIYNDRLRQPAEAKQYFSAVMALDPEHVGAGEPLAELYFEDEEWVNLSPIIDMLVRKAQQEQRDPRTLNELYYRAAKTADELGDYDKALDYYRAAYEIDSTYLPTLMGRADLLYKMQDWDGAGKIYQTILVQHRDSQDETHVVRIYYRLGMVRQQLGERKKALNMFEKALEIDPTHRDTLQAVIDIQAAQGDYEDVVHAKRGLMATADTAEQIRLLDDIGVIYQEKLTNPTKAIAAYNEALALAPDDHQILQKLLDLYTDTEQWKHSVEIIARFAELEPDTIRRGLYYQAAGTICRDKLFALDEAIEYYNTALDAFYEKPEQIPASKLQRILKAFADIDRILTTKKDYKAQERAYRQMIKRLPAGDKVLVDLWHALGEIYRSRLKHYESAVQAFEIAQQLDPTNPARSEILAELYLVAGPDYRDKAIEQHMIMLRREPFKYDSYKAMRAIYEDAKQYDKTWCLCNTLAFLKKASPKEMEFYEQYKPRGFVKAKQRMTEEMWRRMYHPDEDRYISSIMGAIWQGAASMRAEPHKSFGLRRKDKRQIETDQLMFSKIFYYVAQVLNVPLPEVYLQEDKPGDILLANTVEKGQLIPSFVVRQALLQGRSEKEIAFTAARKLAFMRPEHYLKLALPTNTELKTALLSAIVLVNRNFPVPPDMQANVALYLPEMQKRIPPQMFEQLAVVVQKFLERAPSVDMAKWGNGVDATGHRLGFVICGDLEVAARMVSAEPVTIGGAQVKDRITELVLFSVSEEYFSLRNDLGLTIG